MTLYDRDGYPVDLGSLKVEDLNALVREGVDMLRRQIAPDQRQSASLKVTLDRLNDAAVRFTNELYGGRA